MGSTTPKRKNHHHRGRKDSSSSFPQQPQRRYEVDSFSCSSSSESGGLSSPSSSKNGPLHLPQSKVDDGYLSPSQSLCDNSSASTPPPSRRPGTPTTTIGRTSRSPKTKHLSRPTRRRGHRSTSSLTQMHNICLHRSGSNADSSLTSAESNSEHSRYSLVSKHSLSRRGNNTHNNSNGLHGTSFSSSSHSSSSLFGLKGGSTYSAVALSSVPSLQEGDSYDYYEKHHHPPHTNNYESPTAAAMETSPTASSLPPLPSLTMIASELTLIGSLYCRYALLWMRKPCLKLRQRFLYGVLIVAAIVMALVAWLSYDFYSDAVDVCTPPSPLSRTDFSAFLSSVEGTDYSNNNNHQQNDPPRPLVEYYVHGRGIGHYARSVAIVEQLNRAGVDVRMFLTRASMWRAMHEDARIMIDTTREETDQQHGGASIQRGNTTAIAISSLTPDLGFWGSLWHTLERVSGDCEVSQSSGRYPQLIVTDGDFPGMMRAEVGGIPSVGIAHGQLFAIANKPDWVQRSSVLNGAWDKQGRLNSVSSWFTEWQIATHFCFLESIYHSGTVARAPLRPEVLRMAEARKWARKGKPWPTTTTSNATTTERLPQAERIQKLLLQQPEQQQSTETDDPKNDRTTTKHRKLIICYFRDHNGEHALKALLSAGFDVLLFETHYTKAMADNPNRYGLKWVVREEKRDQERTKYEKLVKDVPVDRLRAGRRRRLLEAHTSHNDSTIDTLNEHGFIKVHRHDDDDNKDAPKLIRVMDRSLFVPLMHVADGVASSAGSQLMSECIYSNMPLLALYKEDDSEQRLNVELSNHVEAPCHRPLVFGNSFEDLEVALSKKQAASLLVEKEGNLDSFDKFVREVRSSSVSDTYYRNVHVWNGGETPINQEDESSSSSMQDTPEEEDPFLGLPDAAAIILEIMKQVVQKEQLTSFS